MERHLGAIFHDHFLLPLPTFAISNAHCWLSPQSRDFCGQTIGTPQADFSISIRLNPAERWEVPWTNHTSGAPLPPTDYKRPLSNQLRWLLPTCQCLKIGELNTTPAACPYYRICVSAPRGVAQLHCSTFEQWLTGMAFVVWVIPDLFPLQPNRPL